MSVLKCKMCGGKPKQNLNTIYISKRLQDCLSPISQAALTTVTAPMGYGKTTAVNWYLTEQSKSEQGVQIRISIYSDNLSIFWKGVQNAFSFAGIEILSDYECPQDGASAGFLVEGLCHSLTGAVPYYIFIDDFHLLKDRRAVGFLCMLARKLPENVHLIVASRNQLLSGEEILQLGSRLYQVEMSDLCLNPPELAIYAHKCGTKLDEKQLEELYHFSEGWFSAVYLNLCAYVKRGQLWQDSSDIHEMFTRAMIDPLPEKRREFLIMMGLADEFTLEMAMAVTGDDDAAQLLQALTQENAFVTRLADGKTYRFHHMMKDCARKAFFTLDKEKQSICQNRYGDWYERQKMYIHALSSYQAGKNYDGMLRVIQKDAGILLSALKPEEVLEWINQCPASVLRAYPLSVLVLMRSMFNWKKIPKMLELKELLLTAVAENTALSKEERGNLLGECDLIMSFLMYNDIEKMSRFHRSASAQMSRPAISIQKQGGWTFGSPSVLMMFHRAPGNLEKEREEMDECMPHYYKITNGHGQGAERVMCAEAEFMQGNFVDAQIRLEDAYEHIAQNGQESIALCCDFLALRLSLCAKFSPRKTILQRREELLQKHNTAWLNIFDSICAYYYALIGQEILIPAVFREHRLGDVNFLAPGKPMMELIENQVYLEQKEYVKVIGRSESLLALCENMHYALVALHIRIQTAAAYEKLGKTREARELLKLSLEAAVQDDFLMPFVENYRYLSEAYASLLIGGKNEFLTRITELGKRWEEQGRALCCEKKYPDVFQTLTRRELEITELMALHLSNREIAAKLFLSEGTVKQYINQIYSKLQIAGDTRTKRKLLLEYLREEKYFLTF